MPVLSVIVGFILLHSEALAVNSDSSRVRCPMPVRVVDTAVIEHMPRARLPSATEGAPRVIRGCDNPLFQGSRSIRTPR